MIIDCHVHTAKYSACSVLRPRKAAGLAVARGINALVFTEHHLMWRPRELAALQAETESVKLFAGIEITLAEGYDVVVIPPTRIPRVSRFMSLADLKYLLRDIRDRSFLFAAHPFRYTDKLNPALAEVLRFVDAIEVRSINILRYNAVNARDRMIPRNIELYDRAVEEFSLFPLYNTDAHSEDAIGTLGNILDADMPKDQAGLISLLRSYVVDEYQDLPRLQKAVS